MQELEIKPEIRLEDANKGKVAEIVTGKAPVRQWGMHAGILPDARHIPRARKPVLAAAAPSDPVGTRHYHVGKQQAQPWTPHR
ncbi:hypothetical protein AZSI13_20300 [Azospira sp. I13]|nr:hypothetical protein AZSI13_20300 [Azospira sp. I13]